DRYGYLPMHLAADMGHAGLVASFMDHGVPVGDQANAANWSPLHFAASRGHVDVVEALLGAGADAEARDGNGRTALDVASYSGNNEVAALLRDRSASR
ncbi:MAG: ankyrin repeat domain-containing protein, partial [Candidatus Hydrogenedentes bacterium]|nr:ankyrin repeat domain-containing protein [Candidatus Hydrogenedentota bacterium]